MRWNPEPLDESDPFPLGRAHLEASKLSPSTVRWKTERMLSFLADGDAVVESTQVRRVYAGARRIPLARRRAWGRGSLWSVLRRRRTRRAFSSREVSLEVLGRLIEAAAGVTGEVPVPGSEGLMQRLRAWPSAGGLYPIELYAVVLEGAHAGAYHHDAAGSCLEVLSQRVNRPEVSRSVLTAGGEAAAPVLFVLTAVLDRTVKKYGERGYRFVWLDAGHLAQNLLLAAEALGLAACPIGGFFEDDLARSLGIDSRETVVYVIALGHVG